MTGNRIGQYGKQNPLFMYQGTEGLTIRAAAQYQGTAVIDLAEPASSAGALCAAQIPPPPYRGAMGISVAAAVLYRGPEAGAASIYLSAPTQSGLARCGTL